MNSNNNAVTKRYSNNEIAGMDRVEFADFFITEIRSDLGRWENIAGHLRERFKVDPELPDLIQERSKGLVPAAFVEKFSHIGTEFVAELAIAEFPGAKKLRQVRNLDIQRSCFKQPVPVLICNDGNWETLQIDLHHMTTEQAEQVFSKDHVRNTAEQRAWIEDKRVKKLDPVPAKGNLPYRIVGKRVICMETCEFDVNDLVRLTQELLAR